MQNRCVATGFCKRTLIASKVRNANEQGHKIFLGDTCRWLRAAFVDCRLGVYGFQYLSDGSQDLSEAALGLQTLILSQLLKSTTRYYTVQTVVCIILLVVPYVGTACRQLCSSYVELIC